MSQKISGKNLHYDQTLPPFLARLRGQAGSNNDGPDPLLVRNRRHARPRTGSEEAEDGPLILDEAGNAVSGLRVGVDGAVTETEKKENAGAGGGDKEAREEKQVKGDEQEQQKEKTAGIGGGKKRKVGKVIGGDEAEEEEKEKKRKIRNEKLREKRAKNKKVKLSFGDDEG